MADDYVIDSPHDYTLCSLLARFYLLFAISQFLRSARTNESIPNLAKTRWHTTIQRGATSGFG